MTQPQTRKTSGDAGILASVVRCNHDDLYAVRPNYRPRDAAQAQRYAHLSPGIMAGGVGKLDGVFAGSLPEAK
jgi:hypothetical protein